MATESASSRPRGNGKTSRKLVGFDEFIDVQFAKTRGALRSVDVLSALAHWITASLVFFFVVVMLDHWILPGGLAVWARWAVLLLLLLGSMAYLGYAVGIPLARRISLPFAARTIERSDPSLKNSLINFLDLRRRQNEFSPAVLELVEQQAATDLTRVEVENAVSRHGLVKISYAMLVTVVLGCAYVLFSPKSPFTTFGRVLAPSADISAPTKVTIAEVVPGDAQVFAGDELDVIVATGISDGVTPDRVALLYTTASRKYVDELIDMVPVPDRPRHWRARLRGDNSRSAGLQESFTYRIHAGDYATRNYAIEVIQAPSARVEKVVYDYPEYTGFERRVRDVGDIDALEGTAVTVTARTNMPAEHGGIDFDGDLKVDLVLNPLKETEPQKGGLEGKFVLGFKPDGSPRYESYQVLFETVGGQANPNPIRYQIQTRRDYPPTVSIPKPGRDLSWPANTPLPLQITAEDKDFALRRVTLNVTQGRRSLLQQDLGTGADLGRELSTVHELDLERLGLEAGDVVQYWAEALDNKEPQANRAESTRYEVRVLSRLSPEEQEQLIADAREQIAEKQQELEDTRPEGDEEAEGDPGSEDSSDPAEGVGDRSQTERDAEAIAKILEKLRQEQEQDGDAEADEPKESQPSDHSPNPSPNPPSTSRKDQRDPELQPADSTENDPSDSEERKEKQDQPNAGQSAAGDSKDAPRPDGQSSSDQTGAGKPGENDPKDPRPDAPAGGSQPTDEGTDPEAASRPGDEGGKPGGEPTSAAPKPGTSDQPGAESSQEPDSQQQSKDGSSQDTEGTGAKETAQTDETGKGKDSAASGSPKPGADTEKPAQPGTKKPEDAIPQASDKPGERGDAAPPDQPTPSDPQSPSDSSDRSNKQGQDSGDAPGAGKPSPGQQAPKPGTGQDGSQGEGEQGGKPSDQRGSSDATGPGQEKPSDRPTGQKGSAQKASGQSGSEPSQSEKPNPDGTAKPEEGQSPNDANGKPEDHSTPTSSGQKSSNSGRQGAKGESSSQKGSPGQPESPSSDSSGEGRQPGPGGQRPDASPSTGGGQNAKGQPGEGTPDQGTSNQDDDPSKGSTTQVGGADGKDRSPEQAPGDEDEPAPMPDEANDEYSRRASNLVLDYLRNHAKQGQLDPKLLEELGRTPEQIKKLMERLEKYQADAAKDPNLLSPEEAARMREFEESVRRQRLQAATFERSTTGTRKDPRAVFQGDRGKVPPEYREQYEAYRRSVLQDSEPRAE